MQRLISHVGVLSIAAFGLTVSACGSVSDVTRERVARSEAAVQQAQQTVGTQESAAVELQRARDNLEQAKKALADKNDKKAERFAQSAQLDAELAVAKSQSAASRKAANELLASIQQLRQESQRQSPGQSTATPQSSDTTTNR
jgi:ABC-type transporter Mla subunit MlaD